MAAARKAVPPPVVEDVEDETGPGADEGFEYPTPHGPVNLPSLASIPFGLVRRIRKLPPAEQVIEVIVGSADESALAVIDLMTATEVGELYKAWAEFSGIEVGKLPAS